LTCPITSLVYPHPGTLGVIWTYASTLPCDFSVMTGIGQNLSLLYGEYMTLRSYAAGVGIIIDATSAFRPREYQAHLYEVFQKYNQIATLTPTQRAACGALITQIENDYSGHGLGGTVAPPGQSPHEAGRGLDLSVSGNRFADVNQIAIDVGIRLRWQAIQNDPWHFNLINPPYTGPGCQ
ncbi:MAG: D-alanyl-D-alanine carboxypeptidase family protein, partial [Patescibacteria group bacterium]